MRHFMQPLVCILLVFTMTGAVLAAETETIDRTFDLRRGGEVSLKNINGDITVNGWSEDRVRVVAVKKARGSNASEKLERTEVRISATENRIEIDTIHDRSRKWNNNVSVGYELWLPEEVVASVKTTNGTIDATSVIGDLAMRSTNGNIRAREVGGTVNGSTTNGSIKIEMTEYTGGEMSFRTTNGSITLTAPGDLAMDLDARTTNGSIDSDFPVEVRGKMSRRVLEGQINGGGDLLTLKTTNGSIKLREF